MCPEGTIPICGNMECLCADDVPLGRIGQYSEMSLAANGTAYVSAYNSTHGDLMVARATEAGRIPDEAWEFVDGVPDGPVIVEGSKVRGGIFEPGEDVGLYTDVAVDENGAALVSYFDGDGVGLKFAANTGGVWHAHHVETGSPMGDPELGYRVLGQYTAITLRRSDGHPGIAYFAQEDDGSQLTTRVKFAQANIREPRSASDWTIHVVDTAVLPSSPDPDYLTIPEGVGLFVNAARLSDGSPVVVYYDRLNGDLKLSRFDPASGGFTAPVVLDGADSDVGWYPGLAVDSADTVHVSYVSASNDDLLYVNTADNLPVLVDDGYRIVGQTVDGLPKPEFHFVGDDSSVVITAAGPMIAYQDATWHELLLAHKDASGIWQHMTIAGNEDPFVGGYGFYATSAYDGSDVVMSTWVVDQPSSDAWVEIFRQTVVIE
jgi:hypothetical protein